RVSAHVFPPRFTNMATPTEAGQVRDYNALGRQTNKSAPIEAKGVSRALANLRFGSVERRTHPFLGPFARRGGERDLSTRALLRFLGRYPGHSKPSRQDERLRP